ncbi:unnamed protein product [Prorocentrum cordatum]|uniref:Uncharacterized protein n=1 Tax=Prorocentrum cordatum TaxID=2364126 RepID=A0ABN9YBL3_9DINO|nr:unnamed protein product [Polarella glacialis]
MEGGGGSELGREEMQQQTRGAADSNTEGPTPLESGAQPGQYAGRAATPSVATSTPWPSHGLAVLRLPLKLYSQGPQVWKTTGPLIGEPTGTDAAAPWTSRWVRPVQNREADPAEATRASQEGHRGEREARAKASVPFQTSSCSKFLRCVGPGGPDHFPRAGFSS